MKLILQVVTFLCDTYSPKKSQQENIVLENRLNA